jgi:hypothetical protein
MTIITADATLQAVLGSLREETEIRDPSGKVLGYFKPLRYSEQKDAGGQEASLFDLDEAERTLAAEREEGRSLAEVWARIRSLENQG